MHPDEKLVANARADAEAHRAKRSRSLAADRSRRARDLFHPLRWLLQDLFEGITVTLIAILVIAASAVVALVHTIGITFQAAAILVGLSAVVIMGLWASVR